MGIEAAATEEANPDEKYSKEFRENMEGNAINSIHFDN